MAGKQNEVDTNSEESMSTHLESDVNKDRKQVPRERAVARIPIQQSITPNLCQTFNVDQYRSVSSNPSQYMIEDLY